MSDTIVLKINFNLFYAKMLSCTLIFPKVSSDPLPPSISSILYEYKIANLPELLISSLTFFSNCIISIIDPYPYFVIIYLTVSYSLNVT